MSTPFDQLGLLFKITRFFSKFDRLSVYDLMRLVQKRFHAVVIKAYLSDTIVDDNNNYRFTEVELRDIVIDDCNDKFLVIVLNEYDAYGYVQANIEDKANFGIIKPLGFPDKLNHMFLISIPHSIEILTKLNKSDSMNVYLFNKLFDNISKSIRMQKGHTDLKLNLINQSLKPIQDIVKRYSAPILKE